jgi:ABC-2 type transport system permease protein
MSDLVAAEFLKLRTTRTVWWVGLVGVALPVVLVIATLATSTTGSRTDAQSLLSTMGISGLFLIILGVVGAAGEYRHGTITSTFLVAPDRRRVLIAKGVAYAIGGLCIGLIGGVLMLAISIPWLSSQGHSVSSLGLGAGDILAIAGGSLAYVAVSGVLGVGIGALLTNQVAAIVVVLMVIFVVDPALAALVGGYGRFSLEGLGVSLSGSPSQDASYELFPAGIAGLIYLGYASLLVAAAAITVTERDVG